MAPGSNKAKSGSTGLKILWIPGRKKQHDKGTYKPTNYKVEHKHTDKKVESWSLGGSNAQNEIAAGKWVDKSSLNCVCVLKQLMFIQLFFYGFIACRDKDDEITTPTSAILPSASASVAAVNVENCSDDDDEIHLARVKPFVFWFLFGFISLTNEQQLNIQTSE